jgi:uncharacterized protein YsxB (DUF464 family)
MNSPIQLPLALVELIGKHWQSADAINDPATAIFWFNKAMLAAYELGHAESLAENDMVCEAVETVAQRQIDSIADAAIFSCLASMPDESAVSVTVFPDHIAKVLELYECTKKYTPNGITYSIRAK